ncbi:TetR/AcrR family transcriptional regulator [soil metagenome]
MDPRVERSRRVILDASLAVMAEVGYGELTIEAVAARAGVAKSTIYRHWDGKLSLIADALETLKHPLDEDDPAATPRERLERAIGELAGLLADSTYSACIPAIVSAAERDPEVARFQRDFSEGRRQRMVALVAAAVDAGEVASSEDPAVIAEHLVAPLFFRRLMTPDPYPPAEVPAHVQRVLGPAPGSPEHEVR